MRLIRLIPLAAAVAAIGCSGDSVPEPADLTGKWDFTYLTTAESGATCHGTMTFTITQVGQSFMGTQEGVGQLYCDGLTPNLPGTDPSDPLLFEGEHISAGIASPNEVAFSLDRLNSRDNGMLLQAGLLSGTSSWVIPVKPKGTIKVTGTWMASQQRLQ